MTSCHYICSLSAMFLVGHLNNIHFPAEMAVDFKRLNILWRALYFNNTLRIPLFTGVGPNLLIF